MCCIPPFSPLPPFVVDICGDENVGEAVAVDTATEGENGDEGVEKNPSSIGSGGAVYIRFLNLDADDVRVVDGVSVGLDEWGE